MTKTDRVMLMGKALKNSQRPMVCKDLEDSEKKAQKVEAVEKVKKSKSDQSVGTVSAVALDRYGNIAAVTSTGGKTNKMTGRVGDSAIIGYANNKTCAVWCTGTAEYYMRLSGAHDMSTMMENSERA